MEENQLIDQYDEETILQQIPYEDTRIEDFTKRYGNPNKVVDKLVILPDPMEEIYLKNTKLKIKIQKL